MKGVTNDAYKSLYCIYSNFRIFNMGTPVKERTMLKLIHTKPYIPRNFGKKKKPRKPKDPNEMNLIESLLLFFLIIIVFIIGFI